MKKIAPRCDETVIFLIFVRRQRFRRDIYVYSVYTVFRVAFWIHLFTRYVDGQRLNHPSNYVSSTGFLAAHGGVLGTLYVMVDTKETRVEKGDFNV